MSRSRSLAAAALSVLAFTSSTAAQRTAAPGELPRTHAPRPTVAAITPGDLMTRLYVLADDSMMGREAGTIGNVKGTSYVAAQFRAIGLQPAGENGTFFQTVPLVNRGLAPGVSLTADGAALAPGRDFVPIFQLGQYAFTPTQHAAAAPVVFGGRIGAETISDEQARGKMVILLPPRGQDGGENYRFWRVAGMPK